MSFHDSELSKSGTKINEIPANSRREFSNSREFPREFPVALRATVALPAPEIIMEPYLA